MKVYPRILKCWGKLRLARNYLLIRWNIWLIFSSGPGRKEKDPGRKIWLRGTHQRQEIYRNIIRAAKNKTKRLKNLKYQPMRGHGAINRRKTRSRSKTAR